jgi:hypothetical protein
MNSMNLFFFKSHKHYFSYMSMLIDLMMNMHIYVWMCVTICLFDYQEHQYCISAISRSNCLYRHIHYVYIFCNFQSNVGVPDRQYLWLLTRQKPTLKMGGKYLDGVPSDGVSRRVKPVEDGGEWGTEMWIFIYVFYSYLCLYMFVSIFSSLLPVLLFFSFIINIILLLLLTLFLQLFFGCKCYYHYYLIPDKSESNRVIEDMLHNDMFLSLLILLLHNYHSNNCCYYIIILIIINFIYFENNQTWIKRWKTYSWRGPSRLPRNWDMIWAKFWKWNGQSSFCLYKYFHVHYHIRSICCYWFYMYHIEIW